MAKGKKGSTKIGMPWWRQNKDEVLVDQTLRSCFPKGKWSEGLALYITLKALVSAQYDIDKKDTTTFEIRFTYLHGLLEHSITQENLEKYLQSMLDKNFIQHLEVNEEYCIVKLDQIRDEIDEWTKTLESRKKKENSKSEEVVNEVNENITTPFDEEVTPEKLSTTVHNNTSHNITKQNTTPTGTGTVPVGLVTDSNNSIEDDDDYITVDSDTSIIKFKHRKTGTVIDITDSDIIADHSLTKQEKITKQVGRNLDREKNKFKPKKNRNFIAG